MRLSEFKTGKMAKLEMTQLTEAWMLATRGAHAFLTTSAMALQAPNRRKP